MLDLNKAKLYLFFLLIPMLLFASETSFELDDGTTISGVKTIEKEISDSDLSVLGITIGKSTLANVSEKFRGNEIYHEGDAAKSLNVICYKGDDGTVVAFESGEMGGKDQTITNLVIVGSKAHYRLEAKCSKSAKFSKAIEVSGIRLGMGKKTIEKAKGNPSKDQKNLIIYAYHASKKTANGDADISSTFILRLDGGKLAQLSISKIESN